MKALTKLLLAGSVMSLLATGPVSAATIVATYDFLGAFTSGPNPTISGSFDLTYDPDVTGSYAVSSFSSDVLGSAYRPVSAANLGGLLAVGTNCTANSCSTSFGNDQFFLYFGIDGLGNSNSSFSGLSYGILGGSGYSTTTLTATREVSSPAVPEPATWGMMILGMGAVGSAMRRRQKVGTNVSFA